MAKIIKLDTSKNLGELLAEIKKSEENEITLQVNNKDNKKTKEIVAIVKSYANEIGKVVNITSIEKIQKLGFVAGGDVTTEPTVSNIQKSTQNKTSKFRLKVPKLNFKKLKLPAKTPLILLISTILLVSALIGGYLAVIYYIPKAVVSISIEPRVFSASEDISIVTNPTDGEIKGTIVTASGEETITGPPTGEKETGERATGEIKVYNKTDEDIEVDEGTIITIKKDDETELTFVTTEQADIDAKSEEEVTNSEGETQKAEVFGSKTISIQAESFGEKYNIDNDDLEQEDLEIDGFDSDEVDVELSSSTEGGDSKKVTVVLQKDIDDLTKKATDKLQKDLAQELLEDVPQESTMVEGGIEYTVLSSISSSEVDEETDQIEVTVSLNAQGIYYNNEQIKSSLSETIANLVPSNFEVKENSDSTIFASSKEKLYNTTGEFIGTLSVVKVQTYVAPQIDNEKIVRDITGVTPNQATEYLSKIENIAEVKITQSPNIPFLFRTLPRKANNIELRVTVLEGK